MSAFTNYNPINKSKSGSSNSATTTSRYYQNPNDGKGRRASDRSLHSSLFTIESMVDTEITPDYDDSYSDDIIICNDDSKRKDRLNESESSSRQELGTSMLTLESVEEDLCDPLNYEENKLNVENRPVSKTLNNALTSMEEEHAATDNTTNGRNEQVDSIDIEPVDIDRDAPGRHGHETNCDNALIDTINVPNSRFDDMSAVTMAMSQFRSMRSLPTVPDDDDDDDGVNEHKEANIDLGRQHQQHVNTLANVDVAVVVDDDDEQSLGFHEAVHEPLEIEVPSNFQPEMSGLGMEWHFSSADVVSTTEITGNNCNDLDQSGRSKTRGYGGGGYSSLQKKSSVKSILYRNGASTTTNLREQTQKQVSFRHNVSGPTESTNTSSNAQTNASAGFRRKSRVTNNSQLSSSFATAITSLGTSDSVQQRSFGVSDIHDIMAESTNNAISSNAQTNNFTAGSKKRTQRVKNDYSQLSSSFAPAIASLDNAKKDETSCCDDPPTSSEQQLRRSAPPLSKANRPAKPSTTPCHQRSRSSLVAMRSSIDPSWFASHGLMSQKSFKRYKKEMTKNLLNSVTEGNMGADTQSVLEDLADLADNSGWLSDNIDNSDHRMSDLDNSDHRLGDLDNTKRTSKASRRRHTSAPSIALGSDFITNMKQPRRSAPMNDGADNSGWLSDLDNSDHRMSDLDNSDHRLGDLDNTERTSSTFRTAREHSNSTPPIALMSGSMNDLDKLGRLSDLDDCEDSLVTFRTAKTSRRRHSSAPFVALRDSNFITTMKQPRRSASMNDGADNSGWLSDLDNSDHRMSDLDNSDHRMSDLDDSDHRLGDLDNTERTSSTFRTAREHRNSTPPIALRSGSMHDLDELGRLPDLNDCEDSLVTFRTAKTSRRRHSSAPFIALRDSNFITTVKQPRRSASMNDGLDRWLQTHASSFEEYHKEKKNVAFASLIQSVLTLPFQKSARLTSDEMAVLEKMIRRLSTQDGDEDSDESIRSQHGSDSLFGNDHMGEDRLEGKGQIKRTHLEAVNGLVGEGNRDKPERSGRQDLHQIKNMEKESWLRDHERMLQDNACGIIGNELEIPTEAKRISVLSETTKEPGWEPVDFIEKGKLAAEAMLINDTMTASTQTKGDMRMSQEATRKDELEPRTNGKEPTGIEATCETPSGIDRHIASNKFVISTREKRNSGGTVVSVLTEVSTAPDQGNAGASQELENGDKATAKSSSSLLAYENSSAMNDLDPVNHEMQQGNISTRAASQSTEDNSYSMMVNVQPAVEDDKTVGTCRDSVHTGVGAVCAVKSSNQPKPQLSPKILNNEGESKIELHTQASKNPHSGHSDILTEGMNHLSLAMLVNIYGKLREMSMLGHASVRLADIDVNSHQSLARKRQLKRLGLLKPEDDTDVYLDNAKTAAFVVRAVLDEYEMFELSNDICALNQATHRANMAYDASVLQHFKMWVDESKSNTSRGGYFSKGSVMRNLVNSGLDVVWFSDRHPRDITYCICVEKETATVTVVFHGQEENVLNRIKNSAMMEHTNPIRHEDFEGNNDIINLRAAASDEMMRVRRDTRKSTVDEIREKVDKLGKELTNGGRYHLSVTGHSLGGGLATVAGFYLASDPSLELASAVKVFTFASSRVGCRSFQQSFRHLEETGRLMHARFTNSNDMISLRPFWDMGGSWKFDDWYQHVGIHVQLHVNNPEALDVSYYQEKGLLKELSDLIKSYFCGNTKKSQISEYQHRMHSSREYWISQNNEVVGHGKRSRSLPTLERLYSMKEVLKPWGTDVGGYSFSVYILISFFLSIEMALLLRFFGLGSQPV